MSRKLEQMMNTYQTLLGEMSELVIASENGTAAREPWISIEQAAAYSGTDPSTIRRWIQSGDLVSGQVGQVVRVRASAIDALMTAGSETKTMASATALLANIEKGKKPRKPRRVKP